MMWLGIFKAFLNLLRLGFGEPCMTKDKGTNRMVPPGVHQPILTDDTVKWLVHISHGVQVR